MTSSLQARFTADFTAKIEDTTRLDLGSMRDYAALCEHHYRSARPATATRVLALRSERPSVCGRFLRRPSERQVVGVLVESLPALNCRLRDWALHDRFGSIRHGPSRARALNRELRCISRVIVHPQWRGLGLAIRLVRAALDDPQTPFTESLAAMGNVHPFFQRAGMTAYHRPPHPFDMRLTDALAAARLDVLELAALDSLEHRIENLPPTQRGWIMRELNRWHAHVHRRSWSAPVSVREQLIAARKRLLCEPVYYLRDNRAIFNVEKEAPPSGDGGLS